jgi:hypothetical protein
MTNRSIGIFSLIIGLLSISLHPHQLVAQTPPEKVGSSSTTYEDDRIKVVVQSCNRKLQDVICQAVLTSKSSDRTVDLNGNNIKLVDFEGNEYYPSSLRLANRISEDNLIRTELVENVPFKASLVFAKIPATVTKIALLQIPLSGGITTVAKFRNLTAVDPNPPTDRTPKILNPEVSSNNSLICPDQTKILYRAVSKSYLMYICGAKNPTHYVGIAKDGTQGITLRLRSFDRTRFSADNGENSYTIATDRLIIKKDGNVIQEKIEVLQPLAGKVTVEDSTPKINPKKSTAPTSTDTIPRKKSTTTTSTSTDTIPRKKSTTTTSTSTDTIPRKKSTTTTSTSTDTIPRKKSTTTSTSTDTIPKKKSTTTSTSTDTIPKKKSTTSTSTDITPQRSLTGESKSKTKLRTADSE